MSCCIWFIRSNLFLCYLLIPLTHRHRRRYDPDDDLLHDINTYRKALNLPILEKNYKASCLANRIAYDLEDKHCEYFHDFHPLPGINPEIPNFQRSVKKCDININTTRDGVVMPVCVPEIMHENDLFSNYTKNSRFTPYLNNSKYTLAGVGHDLDKMVLIIGTNTASGDFSSATYLLHGASKGRHWLLMTTAFLSLFVFLFN
ncbi:hypothetical protein MtrunA17_Chr1g0191781 [Medicago truncatula]|uniref:Uncharacterized GPI-anchored protein At5g19230-like domain-containing protein n=1 Tax=Medicago truncatula TaxID=3880 RepID=A0A396JWS9_MEDTR|nr:hypothetical protein MtrunA17_Chr1g0191781 [Medicago truncatula]